MKLTKKFLVADVNYNGLHFCQVLRDSIQRFVRYPSPKCCSAAAILEIKTIHISQIYWHFPLRLTKEILEADVSYSGLHLCQVLLVGFQQFVRYPSPKCCSTAAMLEFKCIHISQIYCHLPLRLTKEILDTDVNYTGLHLCQIL